MPQYALTGSLSSMPSSLHPSDPSSSTAYSRHATPSSDHLSTAVGNDRHSPSPRRPSPSPSPTPSSREGTPSMDHGPRLGTLRRHRPRNSGGFLVPSIGNGSRSDSRSGKTSSLLDNRKGSGRSNGKPPYPPPRMSPRAAEKMPASAPDMNRRSTLDSRHSTPMDTDVDMSDDVAESIEQVPRLRTDGQDDPSDYNAPFHTSRPTSSVPTAIDPAQLVHMALNLSESRRRTSHNSRLLVGGRTASSGYPTTASPAGPSQNYGPGTLRAHLQRQRQMSQSLSAGSASPPPKLLTIPGTAPAVAPLGEFQFSDATLKRAEKFRAYMELKMEHLRLLQFLPPLRSNSDGQSSSYYTSAGVPGAVELKRVTSHSGRVYSLGREYNPVQSIRNRKLRNRCRVELRPGPEQWTDVMRVRYWIDTVQHAARQPEYRGGDIVKLPQYAEHGQSSTPGRASVHGTAWQSKRQPDWSMGPSELLADAYWLEQDAHKADIERRDGNRIFPTFEADTTRQNSVSEAPGADRSSLEAPLGPHRRTSTGHPNAAVSIRSSESDPSIPSDDRDPEYGRSRRYKRRAGTNPLKHAWNKAARARSQSSSGLSSTDSEYEGGEQRRRKKAPRIGEENTAALERFMAQQLQVDSSHLAPGQATPVLISPGTPDKWGREGSKPVGEKQISSNPASPEIPILKTPPQQVNRPVPTIHLDQLEKSPSPHSSMEAERKNSTTPSSPLAQAVSMNSTVISPVSSRKQSPTRDKKFSRHLPKFGGELAKLVKRGERFDDESDGRSSRQTGDPERPSSASLSIGPYSGIYPKQSAPAPAQKDDSLGAAQLSATALTKKRTRDEKDPGSSVSRFFRGRLGDIGRGSNRHTPFDSQTNIGEESDATGSDEAGKTKSIATRQRSTSNLDPRSEDSVTHFKGELPTFKPLDDQTCRATDSQPSDADHISAQKAAQGANRSPRVDRLKSDLERIETGRSGEFIRWCTENAVDDSQFLDADSTAWRRLRKPDIRSDSDRASKSSARLAAIMNANKRGSSSSRFRSSRQSHTGMSGSRSRSRGGISTNQDSVPYPRSHRHWSISQHSNRRASSVFSGMDANVSTAEEDEEPETVDARRVARVEALLLCVGIKARSLYLREIDVPDTQVVTSADAARPPALPDFLLKAINAECSTSNLLGETRQRLAAANLGAVERTDIRSLDESVHQALTLVRRSQSHHQLVMLGCRTFSSALNNLALALRQHSTLFHAQVGTMSTRLASFHTLADEELLPDAQRLSDTADDISGSLSRDLTLELRRVNERVERLIRMRKRRGRWVRRLGFTVLEWVLLGVMWWVWFVWVVLVKGTMNVVRGAVRAFLWFFWVD